MIGIPFSQWEVNWAIHRHHERLGQAFVNDFVKTPWPELFYEPDTIKAKQMIIAFLKDNCYYPNLPQLIDRG